MLKVTENARELLKEILTTHSDEPDAGMRLTLNTQNQLVLVLGKKEQGDQVVEHQGTKVLLVESQLESVLGDATVDVEKTTDGPKLTLQKGSAE